MNDTEICNSSYSVLYKHKGMKITVGHQPFSGPLSTVADMPISLVCLTYFRSKMANVIVANTGDKQVCHS